MSRAPHTGLPRGGWLALVGAARRAERPVLVLVALVLGIVGAAATTAPRLLTAAKADSLEQAIKEAPTSARRLSIRLIDDFGSGGVDDPLGDPRARIDEVGERIDPAVLDRFGPPRLVADTNRFRIEGLDVMVDSATGVLVEPVVPALPTFVTFRVHPELDEHSRLVEGRDPVPTTERIGGYASFEFTVSADTAHELGWQVGSRILLGPDPTDLVTRQFNGGLPDPFVAVLVGVRELAPPDDPYWADDERLRRPSVVDTNAGANIFAFGIATPAQMPTRPFRVDGVGAFALEQRRDLVAGAVDLHTIRPTVDGLTALSTAFSDQPTLTRPGVVTSLGAVLAVEIDQQRAADATLVVAAAGVFGVVLAALGQLLVVSFERRRAWLTVARARGASARQVTGSAMVEMAVVGAFGIALGGTAAAVVVGGARSSTECAFLGALWCGAVLASGAIAASEGFRPVTVTARPTQHPGFGRWGRVAGALVVVLAVASLATFRRRGLSTTGDDLDPLAALVSVMVPLALVYPTRWAVPSLTRRLARRGLAMPPGRLVGLRRVADAPQATTGIVTVLVLALTVAALGLAVDRSIDEGAADASWRAVGAPHRLNARDDAVAEAVRKLPGAVVSASGATRINLLRDDASASVQLTTLDVAAIVELTSGTAADASLPAALEALDGDGRVPVVASERIGGERVRVGDVLRGSGARQGQSFVVVETRSEAFGRRSDWLIGDRSVVEAVAGEAPAFNSIAIGVPDGQEAALRSIADAADATLLSRTDVLLAERSDPLGRAVRWGYLGAAVLAIMLALASLVAIAAVTSRQRRREVAILALLGSDVREVRRAVAAELVPPVVVGVAAGSLVGYVIVKLFDGRYELSAFAAGGEVAIRPAPVAALAIAVALALVSVALIATLTRRIVKAPVAEILRIEGAT